MSHSKHTKKDYSIYIEKWNKSAKKYINTCSICGHKGYSPVVEQEDFLKTVRNQIIFRELSKTMRKLEVDAWGRCSYCAKAQDRDEECMK